MIHTADSDMTLHQGDAQTVLAGFEPDSVDCVITSPPYWGLRDYGTGSWAGGNPDCDHSAAAKKGRADYGFSEAAKVQTSNISAGYTRYDETCPCGAQRTDQQLGLEPTPDLYLTRMVELFREVRRVLAPHGTCWVNLGDSYNSTEARKSYGDQSKRYEEGRDMGIKRPLVDGLKVKDLVMMPARLALALQADGWWLRADIIWAKPNPMPESVTDRPTKSHEYVFLLTKQPRYWFDQEAVREPHTAPELNGKAFGAGQIGTAKGVDRGGWGNLTERVYNPAGRNVRSVWEIATQPFPQAHFATFPEELVRRCLLPGCPEWVCRECGRPRERIVDYQRNGKDWRTGDRMQKGRGAETPQPDIPRHTLGWTDCGHNNYRPGIVLDPFVGSGTVPLVARKHARHSIGIDLNPTYLEMAARRTQQLALEVTA